MTPQDAVPPPTGAPGPATRRRWLAGAGLGALALSGVPPLLLGGCASGPAIDTRHLAQGQDSRVQFLILHFTNENFERSLRILTTQKVSSHYLLSDEQPPVVYRLVDEGRRAWHAGLSYWAGQTGLNASSIGIEIVNLGVQTTADGGTRYVPYDPAQIDVLIPLVRDIVTRHGIPPHRVLGHSDIAPQRKVDPGPLFPWRRLAEAGLVRWPDPARVAALRPGFDARLPDVAWFQRALATHGFQVPTTGVLDEPTRRVVAAFQMKYRPERHDGQPDAETAALLQALNDAAVAP